MTRRIAVVIALGLLARVLIVLTVPTQPVSDFWEYFSRALALRETGSYDPVPSSPDAAHPPAYPLLLSIAMFLVPVADRLLVAKLVNCLLGAATIAIGARLSRDLGGDRAGLLAAMVFAFYPRYLLMPCLLASENLFTPLLLLFVQLAVRAWRKAKALPETLGAGAVLGLLALTRIVAYAFGIVWVVGAVAARRRWRSVAVEILLLLAIEHAVLLPWAIRNQRELGHFTFTTTTGGIGLFIGNNPNATGDWYPWQRDLERARPEIFSKNVVEVDAAARTEALEWIRKNPRRAAKLYSEKLRLILVQDTLAADWAIYAERITPPEPGVPVLPGPHFLKKHRVATIAILRVAGLLLLLFAFGGALLLIRRTRRGKLSDWPPLATFLAAAAYFPLTCAFIAVNGRYRWPVEDLSVPLAAFFLAATMRGRKKEIAAASSSAGDTLKFLPNGGAPR
ncbi:MAG TPA: glycosyltransferase family 39 protein [Thermoanaerobaculia bacterium]|nr:glycosyltransferase family 39 protein [Thermoanaerobaculia bacterium]